MIADNSNHLSELIEEATVDCYDESECRLGFLSVLQDEVKVPFSAKLNGKDVIVTDISGNDRIIKAVVKHGVLNFPVDVLDLEVNSDFAGSDWIASYRKWENS